MNEREELINHLARLGEGDITPIHKTFGICFELEQRYGDGYKLEDEVLSLMMEWPKYSGNKDFPVPQTGIDPVDAFMGDDHLWRDNEYGDNRRELCLYLVDELQKVVTTEI